MHWSADTSAAQTWPVCCYCSTSSRVRSRVMCSGSWMNFSVNWVPRSSACFWAFSSGKRKFTISHKILFKYSNRKHTFWKLPSLRNMVVVYKKQLVFVGFMMEMHRKKGFFRNYEQLYQFWSVLICHKLCGWAKTIRDEIYTPLY